MKKLLCSLFAILLLAAGVAIFSDSQQEPASQEVVTEHEQVHHSLSLVNQFSEPLAQSVAADHTIYSISEGETLQAPDCQFIVSHQNQLMPAIAIREASPYIEGSGEQPTQENIRQLHRALLHIPLSC